MLIDAGISGKKIENGLNEFDMTATDMQGILVTHEHIDHIAGLGVMARRYHIPIYATKATIGAIKCTKSVGNIDDELFHPVEAGVDFTIGDIEFEPLHISHDAADPVAYRFKNENHAMAVVTDLGTYDDALVSKLQDLDGLLLEANHDINMLQTGAYPYPLKRRIMGDSVVSARSMGVAKRWSISPPTSPVMLAPSSSAKAGWLSSVTTGNSTLALLPQKSYLSF